MRDIAVGELLNANGSHGRAGELNGISYPKVRATKRCHRCRHKEGGHTLNKKNDMDDGIIHVYGE